jgi:predicted glycoside hydrolase/deacetylase ChbG (UPF0249 family)
MKISNKKHLIVNADDFGQSRGVNRGIHEAHEHGIVTSASLMVRWPAAADAAAYSRAHPNLSIGIHVDLGEWAYRQGDWVPVYEVVPVDDVEAVKKEVASQVATFRLILGKDPTHIDSHQHVHLREPVRSVLTDVARDLGIPLRHFSPTVQYCGNFYGQTAEGYAFPNAITVDGLLKTLTKLPPGVTELGCHPGDGNDLDTVYRSERAREVRTLCDPRVRTTLATLEIELGSFNDVVIGWTTEERDSN